MSPSETENDLATEVEILRARVAQLEAELIEVQDWANKAVGEAQDRVYWLDRWRIDLNVLMQRRGAGEFRAALRAIREVIRFFRRVTRRFSRA